MRAVGFCRHLENYGWRPWVLTTSPRSAYPAHPTDEQLLGTLSQTTRLEVVPYVDPLQRLLALRNGLRSSLCGSSAAKVDTIKGEQSQEKTMLSSPLRTGFLSSLKRSILDWGFSFPDPQQAWRTPAVKHFDSLRPDQYPDAVLATGGPWSSLVVGQRLAKRFQVPFIADFRDPWASYANFHFRSAYLINKTKKLERSVCTAASVVIANTEELRSKFVSDYPDLRDRFVAITNGFNKEDFAMLVEHQTSARRNASFFESNPGQGIELCHFGSLYLMRTPVALLQAVLELYREGKILPENLKLRFVGAWEVGADGAEVFARELEVHGFLKRDPTVSHEQCLREMVMANALLILQPGSRLQIPAKIYEYLAARRPLLVIGDEGAISTLVNRHHLGRFCRNDVLAIKDLLLKIVRGTIELEAPSDSVINQFDYRVLTEQLVDVLNGACSFARFRSQDA